MSHDGPKVHPFFSKPARKPETDPQPTPTCENAPVQPLDTVALAAPPHKHSKKQKNGSRDDSDLEDPSLNTRELEQKQKPRSKGNSVKSTLDEFATSLVSDANHARRKRQRTASPERDSSPDILQLTPRKTTKAPQGDAKDGVESVHGAVSKGNACGSSTEASQTLPQPLGNLPECPALNGRVADDQVTRKSRPRRMLRLNGQGGFASTDRPKTADTDAADEEKSSTKRKRGRPAKKATYLAAMRYGSSESDNSRIGKIIEDILLGSQRYPPAEPAKPIFLEATNPSKPTHPFFATKTGAAVERPQGAKRRAASPPTAESNVQPIPTTRRSFTTPRKSISLRPREESPGPDFMRPSKNDHSARHGGNADVPWPWQGMVHIGRPSSGHHGRSSTDLRLRTDKSKASFLLEEEIMLNRLARQCSQARVRRGAAAQPLRLPTRSVNNGVELQLEVRKLLCRDPSTHAALEHLFKRLGSYLSAFDTADSDSLPWAQKYAPRYASAVLSEGKEPQLLLQWLKSHTINTVETSLKKRPSLERLNCKTSKPQGKKRTRKGNYDDLDDFIVSSEDECSEMQELSDTQAGTYPTFKGSVVRGGGTETNESSARLTNAVLLSGPHGCGKSAAAYAIAKQLNFDVFEINAASRRSAKDIFDKVGDMALNHQVRRSAFHHRDIEAAQAAKDDEDTDHTSEQLEPDMTQQKSLNTFFKPVTTETKPAAMRKAPPAPVRKEKPPPEMEQKTLGGASVKQKQALILFEEVDLLFDDDKSFWEGVVQLAVQSRRPIIMTCSDESMVPVDALSLYGILRFRPPVQDLAVDYMLLISALEGHVLSRDVLDRLYTIKGNDLRASISELNLWCQMALGDTRSGLSWYLQRWPKGVDRDATGRVLRVISNGTYQHGTDRVDYGISSSPLDSKPLQAQYGDVLERGLDSAFIAQSALQDRFAQDADAQLDLPRQKSLGLLESYSQCADAMSFTDLIARPLVADAERFDVLDTAQPPLTTPSRLNYTTGHRLIQADIEVDERHTASEMSLAAHLMIAKIWQDAQNDALGTTDRFNPTEALENAALSRIHKERKMSRLDFSSAFDTISDGGYSASSEAGLTASCFDGPFANIVVDLAPYVRSIAAFDMALEQRRLALEEVTGGGRAGKRLRTTRASRSAVEGGTRATTRRERWFPESLNLAQAVATGGPLWPRVEGQLMAASSSPGTSAPNSSQ